MMEQFKVNRSQYAIMGRTGPIGFYWVRTLVILDNDGFVSGEITLAD